MQEISRKEKMSKLIQPQIGPTNLYQLMINIHQTLH